MFDLLFYWLSKWFHAFLDLATGWIGAILGWIGGLISTIVGGAINWLVDLLPDWLGAGFSDLAAAFGPAAQYFGYLAGIDVVAPTVMGAYVIKFVIRRLPFIG